MPRPGTAYQKILVVFDGSGPSDNALLHAIRIAKMSMSFDKFAHIIVLHVIQEIHIPATFTAFTTTSRISHTGNQITFREYPGELYPEMEASAIKMLDKKIQEYKYKKDEEDQVTIKAKTAIGYPPDKIIEFANNENVDMIIMGTTRLVGYQKIRALGSVARNMSEKTKCPVMLVR